jgi:cytochrome c oxidase cbb3-type subunit 2
MNRPLLTLVGIVASVLVSFAGLVLIPNWQMRGMQPVMHSDANGTQVAYPAPLEDNAAAGRRSYMAQGCIYCHSQQVRAEPFGADIARGWGERRSVPRDYLLQSPPLLGTMRTGPDLANIGMRQPASTWHHLHLYDARIVSPGSIMPPFKYLYDVVDAAPLQGEFYKLPDAYLSHPAWIVPRPEAQDLVAYLQALKQELALDKVR